MNPLFRIDFSISDSLKIVRKSVLIYETIIERPADKISAALKIAAVFLHIADRGRYIARQTRFFGNNQFHIGPFPSVNKFTKIIP